jgi:hypothetical protein
MPGTYRRYPRIRKRFLPMISMPKPAIIPGIAMLRYLNAVTIAHCCREILRIAVA